MSDERFVMPPRAELEVCEGPDPKILAIARVCHEANRGLCEAYGDTSQLPWDEAPQWQRDSAIKGVHFALTNPDPSPADQHEAWYRDKLADGWVFGPVKDVEKKEHPCLVHYDVLPAEQKAKDYVFRAIVRSLRPQQERCDHGI